jgi:hypothetical protein
MGLTAGMGMGIITRMETLCINQVINSHNNHLSSTLEISIKNGVIIESFSGNKYFME